MPDPRRIVLRVPADLDLTRVAWVVARLLRNGGIVRAWFLSDDHEHLTVDYDPARFSPLTLRDLVRQLGVDAEFEGAEPNTVQPEGGTSLVETSSGEGEKSPPRKRTTWSCLRIAADSLTRFIERLLT